VTESFDFDEVVLPHLDAAYRLARWLVRNEHDAEDVVQEASLRALRYFRTFTGGNGRAWFLRIVRNTCQDWRVPLAFDRSDPFDERQHSGLLPAPDPETLLLRTDGLTRISRAMTELPDRSRELLVRRGLDGLSYQELSSTMGIPMGTVMSGLSRARHAFRGALDRQVTTRPGKCRGRRVVRAALTNRPSSEFARGGDNCGGQRDPRA
jgi:RNA polymerase sigma-70 factor (ECF subfamily)